MTTNRPVGIDNNVDIEEAKAPVEVLEYDEPTDERQPNDDIVTPTNSLASPNLVTTTLTNPDTNHSNASGNNNSIVPVDDVIQNDDHVVVENSNHDNHHPPGGVKQIQMTVAADAPWKDRLWEVISTFWSLGLVAFGGPQAHIAILRDHLVIRRNWIEEKEFMELFAIGQGLPGPLSTKLVVSCALARAGPVGGLTALLLWNLPGFVVLTGSGIAIEAFVDPANPPWYLIGLPPAAIALVFTAFYSFALKLDKLGAFLALFTCLAAILINNEPTISPQSSQFVFPAALALSGFASYIDAKRSKPFGIYAGPNTTVLENNNDTELVKRIGISLWAGASLFLSWLVVLITSILLVNVKNLTNVYLEIFEKMFRIGSIIYGGGQVVLPLLQDEVVPFWLTSDQFFQGLGLAQSMPGPLFNFSAYLGAIYQGVPGALTAFIGLFGPGIILIFAAVPFWARIRNNVAFKNILQGVNASAIGLVGAACVTLWVSAIRTAADAMVFSISLTMSTVYAFQAPYCVLMGGIVGAILHPDALNLGQRPYCVKAGYQEVE